MAQRSCSHYFSWTSGHLKPDGTFSPRQFRDTGNYYRSEPKHNETVLEYLASENVVGIAAAGMKILKSSPDDDNRFDASMVDMLRLGQKMAEILPDSPDLPLVFVGTDPVYLRAIISPEIMGYTDDQIIARLQALRDYALMSGVNVDQLGILMAKLSPQQMLKRLMSLTLPKVSPIQNQALSMVLRSGQQGYWDNSNVRLPAISEFRELADQGADFYCTVGIKVKHCANNFVVNESLIKTCFFQGTWIEGVVPFYDIKRSYEFLQQKKQDTEQLIHELIDAQLLDCQKIALTVNDLRNNCFAFMEMYRQGARLDLQPIAKNDRIGNPWDRWWLLKYSRFVRAFPKDEARQMLKELIDMVLPVKGWRFIAATAGAMLLGYYDDQPLYKEPYDDYRGRISCALMMMECGAYCDLYDSQKAKLCEEGERNPAAFKDHFGMSANELLQHLEKNNNRQRNMDQSAQYGAVCDNAVCDNSGSAISEALRWAFTSVLWGLRKVSSVFTPFSTFKLNTAAQYSYSRESARPEHPVSRSETLGIRPVMNHLFELTAPVFPERSGFVKKVGLILENYYRSPHPDFVFTSIYQTEFSKIQAPLRKHHDCDHVVRTALYSRVLLQMFELYQLEKPGELQQMSAEAFKQFEELLLLAVIYHDVVAENQDKNQEEIQSALYLIRDMKAQVPEKLLLDVAVALANKNIRDVPENERIQTRAGILSAVPDALLSQIPVALWQSLQTRFFCDEAKESPLQQWLRMIIRFGDTVDIVRVIGKRHFDWKKIELPAGCVAQPDFQEKLRTMVKACWNLSAMTGGAGHDNTYGKSHGLREPHRTYCYRGESYVCPEENKAHNEVVRRSVCQQENVWQGVSHELARMAKRAVATTLAGMNTATADDASLSRSANYHCIYDERDLDQVVLPEGLNELQLLWLSMGKVDWLPQAEADKIRKTADDLREHGFQHPLGTLSEETIKSKKAEEILRQRGLETWIDRKVVLDSPVEIFRTRPIRSGSENTRNPKPQPDIIVGRQAKYCTNV